MYDQIEVCEDDYPEADEYHCQNCHGTFYWPSDAEPEECPLCCTPFDGR